MGITRFTNCSLAMPDGSLAEDDLFIDTDAGTIISGQDYFFSSRRSVDRVVDLGGAILAPGLIDAQINGAYGVDFSCYDNDADYIKGLNAVSREIVETGTTSYVPTVITQRKELYPTILPLLAPRTSPGAANVLGYHAEGPFLFPEKKGAHEEDFLLDAPDGIGSWDDVYSARALDQEGVKIITAAPDVPGVLGCIAPAVARGVTFSIGHSNAPVDVAAEAIARGASWVTHLFNAMPQLHHRDPGVIGTLGAGNDSKRPYYGIIADGIHVHPNAARLAYDCHPNGAILVTDAMSLMNPRLPDGRHEWRDGRFIVKEGLRLKIDGTSTLAGSAISLDECVRNLAAFASIPLSKAIRCATWNVAQMLGGEVAQRKGALRTGMDADLVVLSRDGVVWSTWVAGKEAWSLREGHSQPHNAPLSNKRRQMNQATDSRRPKKQRKTDGPSADEDGLPKSKACHSCRRVKVSPLHHEEDEAVHQAARGLTASCLLRKEECRFTTPLHDLQWQDDITARVEHLTRSNETLLAALQALHEHLGLPAFSLPPPPVSPPRPRARAERSPLAPNAGSTQLEPDALGSASTSATAVGPLHAQQFEPELDFLTQSEAEWLLAQSHAQSHPLLPSTAPAALERAPPDVLGCTLGSAADPPSQAEPDQPESVSGFFGMVDWAIGSDDEDDPEDGSRTMRERLVGSANLASVGSQDPRMDVVKAGLVSAPQAEHLVDFFHAHLAPHLFGFPLQLGSWPYLPTGRGTITPLILGSICLVASEREPSHHPLLATLASSDLRDSILQVRPGLSFAPPTDADPASGAAAVEQDLDLELGIGAEEVCALLIYASFSSSSRSDVIAHTAFEWTRGHLRSFMLPSPPPVTYGEVFGLLPARRDLTLQNWLRLWLFAYVVDLQQTLHHERQTAVFDPHYFCNQLLERSLGVADADTQLRDRELVAHARLCALLQKIQIIRASPEWTALPPHTLVAAYDEWVVDLNNWALDNDLPPAPPSEHLPSKMSITLFRLFARNYLTFAASKEAALATDPVRWRFRAASAAAALEMLEFVAQETVAGAINLALPFYVKMISLAGVVLLQSLSSSNASVAPCSASQGMALVSTVAANLGCAPVPAGHPSLAASAGLLKALQRAQQVLSTA
ncbi:hypothetical protein JCM21900_006645 [Sporobolomyces salmonicolor]